MKKYLIGSFVLLFTAALVFAFWSPISSTLAQIDVPFYESEPDIPAMLKRAKGVTSKEEYLNMRSEYFGELRGMHTGEAVDPQARRAAISLMNDQEAARKNADSTLAAWSPIGPNPIPNGTFPWSGRTIAIAVHPTNADIVYVGTAQGGLYRSTDGGVNWTPLMDGAQSLAIGAIAIAPTNPEIVYVGTGEHNFSADSFFGVGVYRIENASTTANLVGPFNRNASNNDVLTGRGISEIIVHPTDPNTIFLGTTSGVGGIGAASSSLPPRGIYRSTNAAGANPTFERLSNLASGLDVSVRDLAIDPINPNVLVAGVVSVSAGGIHRTTNALATAPTFVQTQTFSSNATSELTTEFAAIHPTGATDAVFYAATGNLGGRVLRSADGGATWTQQIDNNFCTPQCFYDIAVGVDPNNPDRVYLGGSPTLVFGFSTTAGTAFTSSGAGVHVDTHAITVAPSSANRIYLGTDGGIYRSNDAGASWQALNNTQFYATQFMSVAVHPFDANFSIGGTQDNGTNYYSPAGAWTRVDGGDGGYTVIDQNAADTTNVRQYHTYFSNATFSGYATRATTSAGWTFRGCNNAAGNGISCGDAVLFYAPLESGPGNPNPIYYGTDRLYRSVDFGATHTVVSQAPLTAGIALSAIGISPQNDNVRIVGQRTGGIFGTTTGSATLVDFDPANSVPNGFIARAVIDPNNVNTAYVTLSNFNVPNIYKTINLNAAAPTWTNISGTVPQVPVSAFVVDPQNSNRLFAGTDIGVYSSTDSGASWSPFGTDLPRIAVFDMAITNASPRKLRIATHGKGMYETTLDAPAARARFDFDGDGKADLSVFRPSNGAWYVQQSQNGFVGVAFGQAGDKLVPADYDGDGKTDVAVNRNGTWYLLRSQLGFTGIAFGDANDVPVPADYDGDGKAEVAVFRPSNGYWYALNLTNNQFTATLFGVSTDRPAPADYDGDGKVDLAVFRPSNGVWYIQQSQLGFTGIAFGEANDKTVPADYDGDGRADIAVFRPSNGVWYLLRSQLGFTGTAFGLGTDIPVAADYDGDGRADIAVVRDGNWYVQQTTQGFTGILFGTNTDLPVPNSFVR